MYDPLKWSSARVTSRKLWDDGLFTFVLDQAPTFLPGQFAMLALEINGEVVKRAYSIASAPGAPLEFYVVRVEGGALTPGLFDLNPGDHVLVWHKIAGQFTVAADHHADVLWLIGTGTGIAPYISMLRDGALFETHKRVVLVHGSRTASQLAYREELEALTLTHPFTYIPALTREDAPGALRGRLPDLLASGALEDAAGVRATSPGHRVMLCGNPEMVKSAMALYAERDMLLLTPRRPEGAVHIEKYW